MLKVRQRPDTVRSGAACAPSRPASARLAVARAASSSDPVVVGLGGCGIDYLASVASYPYPDQKVRTERLEKQGGGNCGNALTCVARLGVAAKLVSMIGDDTLGDAVISEFEQDGVDTEFLQRAEGASTPFTYIIVDRTGGTRTCIHTPGAPLRPSSITEELCGKVLNGATLVYFDGRLTEAAIVLARAAHKRDIPVLVEAERLRPNLDMLMAEADYLVTSAHFPQDWTGEENLGDAILATALRFPALKGMVTTFGKDGAMYLRFNAGDATDAVDLETLRLDLFEKLKHRPKKHLAASEEPSCSGFNGTPVYAGTVVHTDGPLQLRFDRERGSRGEALHRALMASRREAAANAQSVQEEEHARYLGNDVASIDGLATADFGDEESSDEQKQLTAQVYVCSAADIAEDAVVDTTGAGDAFIGSLIVSLVKGKGIEESLQLGSAVSACKCTQLGARPGLPKADAVHSSLL